MRSPHAAQEVTGLISELKPTGDDPAAFSGVSVLLAIILQPEVLVDRRLLLGNSLGRIVLDLLFKEQDQACLRVGVGELGRKRREQL